MRISFWSFLAVQLVALFAAALPVAVIHAEDERKTEPKITDRSHPDYVRCRSEKVIGSLSKRNRVCLANRQWEEVSRKGNDLAREMANDNTSRPSGN
jgi:hypothetical protein